MKKLLPLFLLFFTSCVNLTPSTIKETKSTPETYLPSKDLQKLKFGDKEIIPVLINKQFYYVNRKGKSMLTLTYDNGPDKFSEGLARTKINGKIGFFNQNLEIVLKPVYDFAFPFHKGKAEICTGCKEQSAGEHSMLEGGTWKKINRSGLVIE